MKSVETYVEMYRTAAQAAVPEEQVHAVGVVSRKGATKSMLIGQVSPLIGMIMRRRAKTKAQGLPLNMLMAVTPTRIIPFEYKPKGRSIRVGQRCAEWPRSMVYVELGASGVSRQLTFRFPDGGTIELEGARSVGQYDHMNDGFYAALGLVVAS
jgi:hypothetical protein